MSFTLRNLKQDLEDVGSNFAGAPDLEFRVATKALELEKSGLTYQRVPPGYRFPYGHTHKTQEEVYVVVRGSGRMKVDNELVEMKEWDAVRVPPATWRGYEAGPAGLELPKRHCLRHAVHTAAHIDGWQLPPRRFAHRLIAACEAHRVKPAQPPLCSAGGAVVE